MRYVKTFGFVATALSAALVGACGGGSTPQMESINEVQYGMTSATVVAQMAAMTMDAIKGTPSSCVSVKTACTNYPCNGSVTITIGPSCPLWLGGAATGTVDVTGSWTSVDSATLAQTFTNVQVAALGKNLAVASVMMLKSTRSGNNVTVKYLATNALAGASGSALAVGGTATWDVVVDTKGTADPSDDRSVVDVTSAGAGAGLGASVRVVNVKGAVIDPTCRLNPTAGTADITAVSGFLPIIQNIKFHAACDGKAEVNGVTTDFQLLP